MEQVHLGLQLCGSKCSQCFLPCLQPRGHSSPHDCLESSHSCPHDCGYCTAACSTGESSTPSCVCRQVAWLLCPSFPNISCEFDWSMLVHYTATMSGRRQVRSSFTTYRSHLHLFCCCCRSQCGPCYKQVPSTCWSPWPSQLW